jgi:hypothetical protein
MKVACAQPVQKRRQSQSTTPSRRRDSRLQLKESLRGLSYDEQCAALRPVQQKGPGGTEGVQQAAAEGVKGAGGTLPYADQIQDAFGKHDISSIQAYQGGNAKGACESMGAEAYASGDSVAFKGSPTLHTAAHEAAHIVQQRAGVSLKGGVGAAGDQYEQHADAVADLVVQGKSAEGLLDTMSGGSASSGVQRQEKPGADDQGERCKDTDALHSVRIINDYLSFSHNSIEALNKYLENMSGTLNLLIRTVGASALEQAEFKGDKKQLLEVIKKQGHKGIFSRISNLFGGVQKLIGGLATMAVGIILKNPLAVVTGAVGSGNGIKQVAEGLTSDSPDAAKVGLVQLVNTVQEHVQRINVDLADTNVQVTELTATISAEKAQEVGIRLSSIQESIGASPNCPPKYRYTPEFIKQVKKSAGTMKNALDGQLVRARECEALANAVAAGGALALQEGSDERAVFDEMSQEWADGDARIGDGDQVVRMNGVRHIVSQDARVEPKHINNRTGNIGHSVVTDSTTSNDYSSYYAIFLSAQVKAVDQCVLMRKDGPLEVITLAMFKALSSLPQVMSGTEGDSFHLSGEEGQLYRPEWFQYGGDPSNFVSQNAEYFKPDLTGYLEGSPNITWEYK